MTQGAIAYLATALALGVLDAVWLSLMGARFYRPQLGEQLRARPRWRPAILFYLGYVVGVVALAVEPALAAGAWTVAPARGAVLGATAYATYNLTNQATLQRWSSAVSAVDTGWGALVTAAAATAGYLVTRALAG